MDGGNSPEDLRLLVPFLRSLRAWDQKELATAAGLSASVISRYESGEVVPSRPALERIAGAVGLPLRMMNRVLISIHSARAAVESAAHPHDTHRMIDAVASEISEEVSDLLHSAAALVLAGLPDLATGPWGTTAPPVPEDRQEAPALWARLKPYGPADRRMLVDESRELRSWALCELLCAESLEAGDDALEIAELALYIAERAFGEETWRQRLQGYAWAHLARARRAQGDLPGAEEASARSARLWEAGAPGDPGLLDEAGAAQAKTSDAFRTLSCSAIASRSLREM
ncbi:MAG: helix-turn-helix transcriptional regulator [Thermoanaerobaculia bacterium]